MKQYSKNMTYKNGNSVGIADNSDHVKVREILATGIVTRVDNFGPLLTDKDIKADRVITSGDYELHVVYRGEVQGFGLGSGLTTASDVNDVYYQRISANQ